MRHGANGFTSLPKEGMLRIFSPEIIRRLRPGLNPQTRVLEASMRVKKKRLFIFVIYIRAVAYISTLSDDIYIYIMIHNDQSNTAKFFIIKVNQNGNMFRRFLDRHLQAF
jgi:hypothetical protein